MRKKIAFIITALIILLAAVSTISAQNKIYFTLGYFEQDNNVKNGSEPIEWEVLAIKDDRALLISRYGLDSRAYNDTRTSITWENCSLRKWLNNEFYNNSFSASEKNQINYLKIQNSDNPQYGTKGGNDTADHIFLLSLNDLLYYMPESSVRQCAGTPYAKAKNAEVYPNGYSWWWLRTPGVKEGAIQISCDGDIDYVGGAVSNTVVLVRPAMWINWHK